MMSKKITFQYLREVRYKSTEELFPHWITADFIIDKLFKKHTLQFP